MREIHLAQNSKKNLKFHRNITTFSTFQTQKLLYIMS